MSRASPKVTFLEKTVNGSSNTQDEISGSQTSNLATSTISIYSDDTPSSPLAVINDVRSLRDAEDTTDKSQPESENLTATEPNVAPVQVYNFEDTEKQESEWLPKRRTVKRNKGKGKGQGLIAKNKCKRGNYNCPVCHKPFQNPGSFFKHSQSHDPYPWKCGYCGRTCTSQILYDKHVSKCSANIKAGATSQKRKGYYYVEVDPDETTEASKVPHPHVPKSQDLVASDKAVNQTQARGTKRKRKRVARSTLKKRVKVVKRSRKRRKRKNIEASDDEDYAELEEIDSAATSAPKRVLKRRIKVPKWTNNMILNYSDSAEFSSVAQIEDSQSQPNQKQFPNKPTTATAGKRNTIHTVVIPDAPPPRPPLPSTTSTSLPRKNAAHPHKTSRSAFEIAVMSKIGGSNSSSPTEETGVSDPRRRLAKFSESTKIPSNAVTRNNNDTSAAFLNHNVSNDGGKKKSRSNSNGHSVTNNNSSDESSAKIPVVSNIAENVKRHRRASSPPSSEGMRSPIHFDRGVKKVVTPTASPRNKADAGINRPAIVCSRVPASTLRNNMKNQRRATEGKCAHKPGTFKEDVERFFSSKVDNNYLTRLVNELRNTEGLYAAIQAAPLAYGTLIEMLGLRKSAGTGND